MLTFAMRNKTIEGVGDGNRLTVLRQAADLRRLVGRGFIRVATMKKIKKTIFAVAGDIARTVDRITGLEGVSAIGRINSASDEAVLFRQVERGFERGARSRQLD